MTSTLHHADILEWGNAYDGPLFHAAFCDAPYEMAFMGKDWDNSGISFRPETWAAIARCLHPGAFLFVFGGTINDDLISIAMRQAGLRKHHKMLSWAYGSGLQKSTRMDDKLDRRAGATREVVRTRKHAPKFAAAEYGYREKDNGYNSRERQTFDETAPATDMAQTWAGHRYGLQHLKPAVEPILVFQKPYAGDALRSITATGAGAVNIDGGNGTAHEGWRRPGNQDYEPSEAHDRGRWPANLALSHHPACNGAECFKGWQGHAPCYETLSAVFAPSAEPVYLLDRLPSLFRAVRAHSRAYSNPWHCADEFYRNGRTQSAVGLSDAIAHALGVSLFPGCQVGCPSCRRFGDELFHQMLTAGQDGPASLADALDQSYQALCGFARNPRHPEFGHLSSLDDFHPTGKAAGTPESSTLAALSRLALLAQASHTEDTAQPEQPQSERHERTQESNTSEADSRKTPHCNESIAALVRIFALVCADLAWRYLLSDDIITRKEIYINLQACNVRRLGEQSGETGPSYIATPCTSDNMQSGYNGGLGGHRGARGHNDTGTAARFFYNADWLYERLEAADQIGYFAKPAQSEKEAGLDPMQIALLELLTGEEYGEFNGAAVGDGRKTPIDNPFQRGKKVRRNTHTTLKAISLTRWLATLLLPPDAYAPRRLLVPFAGVGSEMIGAMLAGWDEVEGVELEAEHVRIGRPRLAYWQARRHEFLDGRPVAVSAAAEPDDGQSTIFDLFDAA
jgi:hypothetical protein